MSTNVIPFASSKLPAHLTAAKNRIDEMMAGSGVSFPKLAIKGKVFSVNQGGERKIIMRPDDAETPASAVEVVVLRAQKGLSKVFYAKAFSGDDSEGAKPDCWSNDGEKPDASIKTPVCKTCAACPKNVFGSKVSTDGRETNGKACADAKRLAVAAPNRLKEPMLLQVPPGSLKNLTEYTKQLKARGITDPAAVITKLSFDIEEASPKLKFAGVGFLDAQTYGEAESQYDTDTVQQIVGVMAMPNGEAEEAFEQMAPVAPAPEPTPEKPKAEAKPKAAPKAAEPAPAPKTEPVIEIDDGIAASLDSLLAGFDA